MFSKIRIYFLIILLTIPSVFSLFTPGLPPTHDGEYHVVRFYEFDKVLKSGVLFPVWAPDLNYTFGSPLFLYVYPFPNYMASLFHEFGINFINAFKLNLTLAMIVGALGMYTYGKNKFGTWGGILASISYTYAPYHLLDIYIRGSVGEVWALAFFPLFLLFFDLGFEKKKIFYSLISGIIFSCIIFSHNISSVMFFGFILLYGIFRILQDKSLKDITYVLVPTVSGLLLSSVFILPALLEQDFVVGLKVFNIFDHFPQIYELLIPSWGSGYSGISNGTQMSFQIGVINIIVIVLTLFSLKRKADRKKKIYILFFLILTFFSIFLVSLYSKIIYQIVPFMQLFQFPWRFLSITIFSIAILTGGITCFYKSRILYVVLLVFMVLTTVTYAKAPYFHNRDDKYYIQSENFLYGTNSIGNAFQTKWLPQQSSLPASRAVISSTGEKISPTTVTPTEQVYSIVLEKDDVLVVNTAYFPGWNATVNGRSTKIINANGLMRLNLSRGINEVRIELGDTFIRGVGKFISFVTFFIILLILIRKFATIRS